MGHSLQKTFPRSCMDPSNIPPTSELQLVKAEREDEWGKKEKSEVGKWKGREGLNEKLCQDVAMGS